MTTSHAATFKGSSKYYCKKLIVLNFLQNVLEDSVISNLMKVLLWEASCPVRTKRHDKANSSLSHLRTLLGTSRGSGP